MLTLSSVARIVFFFFIGLLIVVVFSVTALTISAYRERANIQTRKVKLDDDRFRVQTRLDEKRSYIEKMQTDPEFLQRVIREKLHYVRSDEKIFYLEQLH